MKKMATVAVRLTPTIQVNRFRSPSIVANR